MSYIAAGTLVAGVVTSSMAKDSGGGGGGGAPGAPGGDIVGPSPINMAFGSVNFKSAGAGDRGKSVGAAEAAATAAMDAVSAPVSVPASLPVWFWPAGIAALVLVVILVVIRRKK